MARSKALIKYRHQGGSRSLSIKILLKQLGLPRHIWCVRNFWEHWHGQLDYILYDAEKIYKRHAVRVHPRKATDDQEESKNLNSLWMTIKERIRQHVQPGLLLKATRSATKQLKPPKGYFARTCQAEHCGKKFFSKSSRVNYCCEAHMYSTLNARRYKEKKQKRRKILVKCAFAKCGRLFWKYADLKKRHFCSSKCCQYHHCYDYAKRNRAKINKKIREINGKRKDQIKASNKRYREEHREELNKKKLPWKRKWRKKMKALRPVVRQSLLDLLNLVGSSDHDIRNRHQTGDAGLQLPVLPVNAEQVGALLPNEHEAVELNVLRPLAANNDQVVLRPV